MIGKVTLVVSLMAVLTACGGSAPSSAATPVATVPPVKDIAGVSAQGKLMPLQSANLSFSTGGEVAEVPVKEGDHVKAGDLLVRLQSDTQQAAVARAEAGLAAAKANEAKYKEQLPEQIAAAEADVQSAQAQIASATAKRDTAASIAAAESALTQAQVNQRQAEDAYKKVIDKNLLGPKEEQARLVVENAKRATTAAQLRLDQLKSGSASSLANNAGLAAAQASLSAAQAKLDRLNAEAGGQPNPTYAAAIQQAEAALQSAKTQVADTELHAPFDGTVAQLNVKVGETVTPGQTVAILADMSGWQIQTDDLTEIKVPNVTVGQPVTIKLDALPDLSLKGEVTSIGALYQTKSGDIVYPVKVKLVDSDPRLRWGMTMNVTFEK